MTLVHIPFNFCAWTLLSYISCVCLISQGQEVFSVIAKENVSVNQEYQETSATCVRPIFTILAPKDASRVHVVCLEVMGMSLIVTPLAVSVAARKM